MERKIHIQYLAVGLVSLLGFSSCSNEEYNEPALTLSTDEIIFATADWQDIPASQSRALLFDSLNIVNPVFGGGNFTVSAYTADEGKPYFKDARVWYFDDPQINRWIILNDDESQATYYWPNSINLNFFAYMPVKSYSGINGYQSKETYITLGSYVHGSGQTFSCNLPATVDENTEMQEFIYAYATNQKKRHDALKLLFHHPYSTINFKIGVDSYRLTIKSIQLNGIYLDGTYSTGEQAITGKETGHWIPDEAAGRKLYTMELNKRIPNELNYNTLLFDDFLIMPQSLENVTLTLNFNRHSDTSGYDDAQVQSISVDMSKISAEWLQGRKYTYTIKIGDNKDEIYFNVEVEEDWIKNGVTNIDVE